MRLSPNQILIVSAAGILAVGAGWAATIANSAPEYQGPDPSTIRELAARVQSQSPSREATLAPGRISQGRRSRATTSQATQARIRTGTSTPAPPPLALRTDSPPSAVSPAESQEEAVKNIALVGVTEGESQEQAWFVDISSNDRQTVARGESAFGFTVKEIHPESVLLTRGSDEFVVRMGDKQIPVASNAGFEAMSEGGSGRFGGPGGFGGREGFGRGSFGDRGGRDRGDFMQRMAEFRSRFGSSGRSWGSSGRSWGGDSGRSWRSDSSSSSSSRRSYSRGGDSRGSSSYSSRYSGGYRPGGFSSFSGGFGSYGFGGRGYGSRNTSTISTATSNPQTARRSGGRLVSGVSALPTPQPISNPQTQRRTGTTSGQAFGDQSTYGSRGTGYNGSSRSTNYGNRGR